MEQSQTIYASQITPHNQLDINELKPKLRPQEIAINQVAKIIIFSDCDHLTEDSTLFLSKLENIKTLELAHFALFAESEVVENIAKLSFSLEEWQSNQLKSLAPALMIGCLHILMGSEPRMANEALSLMLKILYIDDYFKSIVLNGNFLNYNPHSFGLPKEIPLPPHYKMNQKGENTLKFIQTCFKDLDNLPKNERMSQIHPTLSKARQIMCNNSQLYNPALFAWISEYAAVAKTIAIGKIKSNEEKETGDFRIDTMWKLFYGVGLSKKQHEAFINTLVCETRTHFMANKVIRMINQFAERKALELNLTFAFCVGKGHIPMLLKRLEAHSRQPIQVIDIPNIVKQTNEEIASYLK